MLSRTSQVFLNLLGPSKQKLLPVSAMFRELGYGQLTLNKYVVRNLKIKLISKYFTKHSHYHLRGKIPYGTICIHVQIGISSTKHGLSIVYKFPGGRHHIRFIHIVFFRLFIPLLLATKSDTVNP